MAQDSRLREDGADEDTLLRRRLCLDPGDRQAQALLGTLLLRRGSPRGVAWRGRISALEPRNLRLRLAWAAAVEASGRKMAAARLFKRVAELAEGDTPSMALRVAHQLRRGRRHGQAAGLLRAMLRRDPGYRSALAELGETQFDAGKLTHASTTFRRLLAEDPTSRAACLRMSDILARGRDAEVWLMRALAVFGDLPAAHMRLARMRLPGPDYLAALAVLHEEVRPRSYVEIGVASGASLRLARPPTVTIGIDPEPRVQGRLPNPARIYRMRSDDFFREFDLTRELGGTAFHVAFIDGLHTFAQTLRDFINLERRSGPDSIILLHDCLPLDRRTSALPRQTSFWSGDCWRIIPCLMRERPDLLIEVIRCAPTGLALVRNLDPQSRHLASRYSVIVDRYSREDLGAFLERCLPEVPNIPNSEAHCRSAFAELGRPVR